MAQEVEFAKGGGEGKIRSFWVGFGLSILTLGIYSLCWYYFVNDELKDIGQANDDGNLGQSSPALSVTAVLVGGYSIQNTLAAPPPGPARLRPDRRGGR